MKRTIRILAVVGGLALIAALTIGVVRTGRTTAQDGSGLSQDFLDANNIIDQTTVTSDRLLITVNATGRIEPLHETRLNFETNAVVQEILVEPGDFVEAGDVLARLDLATLETRYRLAEIDLSLEQIAYNDLVDPAREVDIAAQEAQLDYAYASAGAAYDRAASANDAEIARLEAERADNQRWQSQIQRDQQMALGPEFRDSGMQDSNAQEVQMDSSIESAEYRLQVERAEYNEVVNTGPDMSRLAQANADIVQAQIALDNLVNGPDETDRRIAEASLELAELSLQQVALQLEQGVLVAPFDGMIAENNLTVGEVPPTEAAMTLMDTSGLYIDLPVDENDIRDVQVGQTAALELDALPNTTITGTVTRVAVTPTQSGAVVTYTVRVRVEATDQPVRVGMTATAEVIVAEQDDVITLPNRFIRRDRATNRSYVTVVDDGGDLREVVVELGERNETESAILDGLQPGETVVLIQRETGALDN